MDAERREALIDASGAAHDVLHLLNPDLATVHDSGPRLPEECVLAMGTDAAQLGVPVDDPPRRLRRLARRAGPRHRVRAAPPRAPDPRRRRRPALGAQGPGPHGRAPPPRHGRAGRLHRPPPPRHRRDGGLGRQPVRHVPLDLQRRRRRRRRRPVPDRRRPSGGSTGRWRSGRRRRPTASALLDVRYEDLVADPAGTLRRIYAAADIDPPDVDAMVRRYDADQPRHAKGAHRYRPEDFGIDPADAPRAHGGVRAVPARPRLTQAGSPTSPPPGHAVRGDGEVDRRLTQPRCRSTPARDRRRRSVATQQRVA